MRVVALFRVSTEKQEEQGSSLDSQAAAYHAMAARECWTTVQTFRGCESATQASSDRRVLGQVLECIRRGGVDAIWVYEQSRLTRGDELDVALLRRELEERGVKVIINGTVRDLSSIDESFMFNMQGLVDRTESKRTKERLRRGFRTKARQGKKVCGDAAYGYRNPPPGDPNRGTLQVVPEEAATVRRIFEMFAKGMGTQRIAQELNELGIPSPRGRRWGKTTIQRIIDNPAYIGTSAANVWVTEKGTRSFRLDLKNPDAILVEDAHEAIIPRDLWDAAHGRPKQPRTGEPRMLTGLLYVGGAQFAGDADKGKKFYRASDRRRGAAWLEAEATDDRVWDAFARLATGEEFVQRLLEQAHNPREQQLVEMEIEYLGDQIDKHQKRLDGLIEMRADGEIAKEVFLKKRDAETAAIERLGKELAEQRAKAVVLDGTHAARIVKAVQTLLAGRTRLTREQKRRILTSIARRVDAEVERVARPQTRAGQGGFASGRCVSWEIRKIEFRLALPPDDAASGVPRERGYSEAPAAEAATWADEAEGARRGQLVTTESCSGRRGPARR